MCLKILELRNKSKKRGENEKGSGELRRRVSLVTQSLKRGGSNVLFISLPRPLKDRLLLTGTAPLSNLLLGKTSYFPIDFPWFAFKLFAAKPIWWKRYCTFWLLLGQAFLVTMLQLLLRQPGVGRMVLRERLNRQPWTQDSLRIEDRNPKKKWIWFRGPFKSTTTFTTLVRNNATGAGSSPPLMRKLKTRRNLS